MNEGWIGLLVLATATAGLSQDSQTGGVDHSAMSHAAPDAARPDVGRESGQAAFAALGETVDALIADSTTDWSKVDIDALRRHLVDMDNVALRARVVSTQLPNGARFSVSGDGEVADSIRQMVRNHAGMAKETPGWAMTAANTADGAVLSVTSADGQQAERIAKLGFFGVMTIGNHHRRHHQMVARGEVTH